MCACACACVCVCVCMYVCVCVVHRFILGSAMTVLCGSSSSGSGGGGGGGVTTRLGGEEDMHCHLQAINYSDEELIVLEEKIQPLAITHFASSFSCSTTTK